MARVPEGLLHWLLSVLRVMLGSAREGWMHLCAFDHTSAEARFVALAETHVGTSAFGVAVVGNVFTHPDTRGRGYASMVTSAVVAALLLGDWASRRAISSGAAQQRCGARRHPE
jgi:hypothetical protein